MEKALIKTTQIVFDSFMGPSLYKRLTIINHKRNGTYQNMGN